MMIAPEPDCSSDARMLLAFETVARTASACVMDEGGHELAYQDLAGAESERGLATLLDDLIRQHGKPSALAVASGPGSFTGLRIGVVAARTLAWMEQIPVHAVDSLAAIAAERGDGLWWVLLPLKRDTTFHGVFRVRAGRVDTVRPTVACLDVHPPAWIHDFTDAVAVGPALITKPDLARAWCPGITVGDPSRLSARGVAMMARQEPALAWDGILPAYHQASAPELQRQQRERSR